MPLRSIADRSTSFRSRLEGWNIIKFCSAVMCVGPKDPKNTDHMHNNVHDWMGGQMDVPPAAVNDPMFNLHHCNVDRILESWMQRYVGTSSDPTLLPTYVPVRGGHPGHSRDDYMVPFLPLITAGGQYRVVEEWGYTYDELIQANIPDDTIPNCSNVTPSGSCPICDANGTCIDCNTNGTCIHCNPSIAQTCPTPMVVSISLHSSTMKTEFPPRILSISSRLRNYTALTEGTPYLRLRPRNA